MQLAEGATSFEFKTATATKRSAVMEAFTATTKSSAVVEAFVPAAKSSVVEEVLSATTSVCK